MEIKNGLEARTGGTAISRMSLGLEESCTDQGYTNGGEIKRDLKDRMIILKARAGRFNASKCLVLQKLIFLSVYIIRRKLSP